MNRRYVPSRVQSEAIALAGQGCLRKRRRSWVHEASGRRFPNYWTIERLTRHQILRVFAFGFERWAYTEESEHNGALRNAVAAVVGEESVKRMFLANGEKRR
jgi:hypothetical protein